MTNRTWYLIKASSELDHPFKQSNGRPLIVKKGEWFTSEVPEHVLSGSKKKSKNTPKRVETINAIKPTMQQCLLDGYGTHCDIWPAYKDDDGFHTTSVVLEGKSFEDYEFVTPIDETEYENSVRLHIK